MNLINDFKEKKCPCKGPCNGCGYYCIEYTELECINCGECMYFEEVVDE